MPDLPEDDVDELDIDDELVPALARIIASYISKEKALFHTSKAKETIMAYESKVRAFILSREAAGDYTLSQTEGCSTSKGVCDA